MNLYKNSQIKVIVILLVFIMSGCAQSAEETPGSMDITQAYQTVEARLTEAVGQTPIINITDTAVIRDVTEIPLQQPTETVNPETPTKLVTASTTPIPASDCYKAAAAYPFIDITIEDDTEMAPGQEFTKIWRVVNVGTCVWTGGFSVEHFSGEQLGITNTVFIATEVAPNQTIDLEVDMLAPLTPAVYQSNWKIRNSRGELFGIGPNGNSAFWVRIIVVELVTETPSPTATISPTPNAQASGTVTLAISDTLDLDSVQINGSDSDLVYQYTQEDPPNLQVVPLGGTLFSVFGLEMPTLEQCQNAELISAPIDVEQISFGTFICYRTSLGLPGWARYDALSPDVFELTFEILTWTMP